MDRLHKTSSGSGTGFFPISVQSLRLNKATDFDLYLPAPQGRAPVLYRQGALAFSQEALERLESHQVRQLYVRQDQDATYAHYIEDNLGDIVADPSLSMQDRSETLYKSAKELVREVMEDPRSGAVMERSGKMVDHLVHFLYTQSQSFTHLMQITSFDYYTYTHSVNVFVFSCGLAQRVGFNAEEVRKFGQGCLLHDIGKSLIDPAIVNCRGKLNEAQWNEMRKHPVYGYELLLEQGVRDESILDVTRHHHEKLTGKGYPDGLSGDDISPWARICTIADIFDALTTRRSYKQALDSFPSLQLMQQEMRDELDPDFFRTFVGLMGNSAKS